MEKMINIHIEKMPEGMYLATSGDVQGLVAQGRTIWETMEIARDVARKIIESQKEKINKLHLKTISRNVDMKLVLEY